MHASHPEPPAACANCAAPLDGEFCSQCGQRRFRSEDRTLRRLLGEFFAALTDLDSRVWRSLRALLFQPGRLTADWWGGRRAYWMSPVALFLLANLLYFLAPAITDFDLPLHDHVTAAVVRDFAEPGRAPPGAGRGQPHSPYTEAWVRARVEARRRDMERDDASAATARAAFASLARDYAQASANYSKLLIVLHVPFLALGLQLLMLGRRRHYAEHFVAALHYFAFVLLFFELVLLPASALAQWLGSAGGAMPAWARLGNAAVLIGYAVLLLRRSYGSGWPRALAAGVALPVLLFAINTTVYRALQFAIVLALT